MFMCSRVTCVHVWRCLCVECTRASQRTTLVSAFFLPYLGHGFFLLSLWIDYRLPPALLVLPLSCCGLAGILLSFLNILCMFLGALSACRYVLSVCVRSTEVRSVLDPGTGTTLSCLWVALNLGPPEEQLMLLTTEPSL